MTVSGEDDLESKRRYAVKHIIGEASDKPEESET
jgi:hypothetical protein